MIDNKKVEFMIKLLTNKKEGGRLNQWAKHIFHSDSYIGIISEDPSGRFNDGAIITTSRKIQIHEYQGQQILETVHSYYYLGEPGTKQEIAAHYDLS